MSVPSYFQPYIVASHGPFHSKYAGVCHRVMLCFSLLWSPWICLCQFLWYIFVTHYDFLNSSRQLANMNTWSQL
jgi:hypothetical protein